MPWNKVTVIIETFHPSNPRDPESVGEQYRTTVEREFPSADDVKTCDVLDVVRSALLGAEYAVNGDIQIVPDDAEVNRIH